MAFVNNNRVAIGWDPVPAPDHTDDPNSGIPAERERVGNLDRSRVEIKDPV
jgi:hypothetical protein